MNAALTELTMLRPRKSLRPYVQAYYRMGGLGAGAMLGGPGLSMDLWWLQGPPLSSVLPGGRERRHESVVMGGALTRMLSVRREPGTHGFGVSLAPGVAPALFGVAPVELRDRFIPLGELLGRHAPDLNERMREARDTAEQVHVIEAELLRLFRSKPDVDQRVVGVLERLSESLGGVSVNALAASIGYTRRRFQDLVRDSLGVTPKQLIRILRFRRALRLLEGQERCDWLDVVHECGYADQSHLIRHFHEFTGLPPGAFARMRQGATGGRVNSVPL